MKTSLLDLVHQEIRKDIPIFTKANDRDLNFLYENINNPLYKGEWYFAKKMWFLEILKFCQDSQLNFVNQRIIKEFRNLYSFPKLSPAVYIKTSSDNLATSPYNHPAFYSKRLRNVLLEFAYKLIELSQSSGLVNATIHTNSKRDEKVAIALLWLKSPIYFSKKGFWNPKWTVNTKSDPILLDIWFVDEI